ncbi:hypothetical protein Tco_0587955 [Tanacetum coccineum]
MTEINKKQYIVDVRVMNYLLQAIPNDIYNSVDASKEGDSLEYVYERLTTLVNIIDRDTVSYDQLYDSLVQFEPHVQASKAKRAGRNQDPLALIAQSNAPRHNLMQVLLIHIHHNHTMSHILHRLLIMKKIIKGSYKGILKKTDLQPQ